MKSTFYLLPILPLSIFTSLVGTDNIELIDDAVQTAVHYNALGILITDWSAYGHVSPLEVSLPAFAAGAALSWNSKIKQVCLLSFFHIFFLLKLYRSLTFILLVVGKCGFIVWQSS